MMRTLRLATLVTLSSMIALAPESAEASRRTTAFKRQVKRVFGVRGKPTVITPGERSLRVTLPDAPVWAAFGKNDAKAKGVKRASNLLGRSIARAGFTLATGGGQGLPKDTETGAYFSGGRTVAFTPKGTYADHHKSHKGNIGQTTDLVLVGTGGGSGTIAREGPMAQAADIASYANGGAGTFGEAMAQLHNRRGVMAALAGSGGVADGLAGWVTKGYLNAKPTFRVVSDARPDALVRKAADAYTAIGAGAPRGQKTLVSPGRPKRVLGTLDRKGRVVASFLVGDERASPRDRAATIELVDAWSAASRDIAPEGGTNVLPSYPAVSTAVLSARSVRGGARTVTISPLEAPRGARPAWTLEGVEIPAMTSMRDVKTAYMAYGESETALFAAAREVTQDSDVVFLSSADYRNLSGLAYALRDERKPIIAVLANESTFGHKVPEIIKTIEPKAAATRVVVARTPQELVGKVKDALALRAKKAAADAAAKRGEPDGRNGLD